MVEITKAPVPGKTAAPPSVAAKPKTPFLTPERTAKAKIFGKYAGLAVAGLAAVAIHAYGAKKLVVDPAVNHFDNVLGQVRVISAEELNAQKQKNSDFARAIVILDKETRGDRNVDGYGGPTDSMNQKIPVVSLDYVRPKKEQYSEVGPENEPVCEHCTCNIELPVYSTVAPAFTTTGTRGGKTDNSFARHVSNLLATPEKTDADGETIPSGEKQLVNLGCQPLVNGTGVVCNSFSTVIRVCEEAQPSDALSCFGGALERLADAWKLAIENAALVYTGLRGNGDCDKGYVRLKEGPNLYTVTAYRETGTNDCASAPAGEKPKTREGSFKTSR